MEGACGRGIGSIFGFEDIVISFIIGSGAEYRKLNLANLSQFEGLGLYYDATVVEAQLCANEEVAVVGAGNSAGRPAIFLANVAKHVHTLVRGTGLSESMSQYLIRRIEEIPTITLYLRTHVVALEGQSHLEPIAWQDDTNAQKETARDSPFVFHDERHPKY